MVVTPTTQLRFIEFSLNQFPSILDIEFPPEKQGKDVTFTAISLNALLEVDQTKSKEVELCRTLLSLLKGDTEQETTEDNLLLVKSKDTTPQDVYGATVYRESVENDNLVVKFGDNIFPCVFNPTNKQLVVGNLEGKFKFLDKKTVEDVPYQKLVCYFSDPANRFLIYVFGVQVQPGINFSEPMFDIAIDSGDSVAQFFQVPLPPLVFDDSPVFKMGELEVGDYEIEAISRGKYKEPKKGIYCYFIHLTGGAKVFASNGSQKQLAQTDDELGTNLNHNWEKRVSCTKTGKLASPFYLRVRNKRTYKDKNGKEDFAADSQILPGVPKQLSNCPVKVIQQAPLQLDSAQNAEIVINNKAEAIDWAVKQGLTDSEAQKCFFQINPKLAKHERKNQFMTLVGDALKGTIQPTIDVVSNEISEDDIPY